jgi:Pyruvate/2-oxoacid:ferredoxin oxidoreductase delta subunit
VDSAGDSSTRPASALDAGPAQVALHYFSGTGNTFRVAEWIAQGARTRGADVAMVAIAARSEVTQDAPVAPGRHVLGILTPTHGFTAPWAVLAYAATVPGVRGADVFAVATRAGWYAGPLRLPGLEGTAAWLVALILVLRGGRLVGVKAIDMPSNWTALHWGMNAQHVAAIVEKAHAKTSAFADRILDGRTQLTGWISLATGLLLAPISLGYVLLGRRLIGKLFFADERCTSCGLCEKHCPLDAVHLAGASPKKPYWSFRCESCMRCMNVCPEDAIQASWVGAAAESWVMIVVFEALVGAAVVAGRPASSLSASIVATVALVVVTLPVYRVAWVLGRSRAAAWLLGHLTPTRIFRRYREPGTDLRDL